VPTGVDIAEMSWSEFAERAPNAPAGLLPVGSVEAYGPHLPLGTDGLVAQALARRLGERLGCLVGPLIPVGWTAVLADFPGTISVPTEALRAYCKPVAASLLRSGFRSLIFINGHAGNITALDELCYELAAEYDDRFLACINTWQFIQPLTDGLLASKVDKFGHAGELNTSVMLHLHPELVRMEKASKHATDRRTEPGGVVRPYSFRSLTSTGSLGDPTLANEEKGKRIVELALDRMAEYLSAMGVLSQRSST
jgi:creatinine amidohydrolase